MSSELDRKISRRSLIKASASAAGALLLAACAQPTPAPEPTKAPAANPTAAPAEPTKAPATSAPAQPTKAPATSVPPTAAPAPVGTTKIVYWRSISGAGGDAQEELAKRFNAAQTAVQVEVQYQGSYPELQQKLQAALAARTTPDVVMFDSPQMPYFAKNGAIIPLDELAKGADGLDIGKAFFPGLVADGYQSGKLFALPFARSTPILYYNSDMFKEVTLPDRAPETWTEFQEFCTKLTKKEGDIKRVGYSVQMGATTAHWYFQELLYAFGNDVSDDSYKVLLDQPAAIEAAKFLQDMVFKQGVVNAGTGPDGAQGEFTNQRSGMHFGSTGSLVNIVNTAKFKVGVGFMPAQKRRQVPIGGSVLSIMSASAKEKQAAAWKFLKHMTSPESNVYFVQKSGYMPTSQAAADSAEMKDFMTKNPNFKVAVAQLQFVRPQASIMAVPESTELFRQLVEKLVVGNVDPTTAMKDATAALTKAYNETFK